MTRYARIESGAVAELFDTAENISTLFPPELVWVPATTDVQHGWTYDGVTFTAPVVPPFHPQDALPELRARRDRLLEVISGMQADYITSSDMTNAGLCRDVKAQLKVIDNDPTILAATSRTAFNSAVLTRWKAIASTASPEVRAEFARYATAA
jgi:hypothetical protein